MHLLNQAEGLYRVHLSGLDPVTRRRLQYRVMYRVHDEELEVIVITAAALPPASRRRKPQPGQRLW